MAMNEKKFLDEDGVRTLWSKVNMQDYPNNETLVAILNAIDEAKADKEHNHDDLYYTDDEIDVKLEEKSDTTHKHNYYGVCSTPATTVEKTVEIEGFELVTGAMVIVKFDNANSASNPTLNVSGTGAKPMYRYGTTVISTGTTTTGWYADSIQLFVYDGTGWIRDYWNNTTYSNASLGNGYGTCSTAASTKAKTASLSNYALSTGGCVSIKFTNSVPAGATLNVNSKGAKAMYYRGSAIVDNIVKAGDVATFVYSGTYYHLIAIDRWQQDITSIEANAKSYTDEAIANLVGTAPESLNTIYELATAFEENEDVIEALTEAVAGHTHSFNDLEDKPFGEEEATEVLVEDATIEGFSTQLEALDDVAFWDQSMNFIYDTLIITLDGTEYKLDAFSYDSRPHWGDSRLIGETSNESDIPFLLETAWGSAVGSMSLFDEIPIWNFVLNESIANEPHTIKIEAVVGEEIKTLDEKYIPDTIARATDIDELNSIKKDKDLIVTYAEGSTFGVTHSSGEIYEAVQNGITVYFQKGAELLNLMEITPDYATFFMFYMNMEGKPQQKVVVINGSSIMLDQDDTYNYATTTQLNSYYNKTEVDNLLSSVGTSEDVLLKTAQTLTDAELSQVRSNLKFIGQDVAGKTFTINGKNIVASPNAEIFGDYVNNKCTGQWSIVEGSTNVATGRACHVEGAQNQALNDGCHVEGVNCVASGYWSHAEGEYTRVTSYASHAEGSYTKMPDGSTRYGTASGYASHIEGGGCHAQGSCSHSEGLATTTKGNYSHSEGRHTIAGSPAQHVEGTANIEDTASKYIHIAGNGEWSARSNAYHLDWDGNGWFAGDVYVGSTGGIDQDEGSKKLATEEYVDTKEYDFFIMKSSTPGSNKKFKITIDDDGILSSEEVVE